MATPRRSRRVELAVAVGVLVAGAVLVYAILLASGVAVHDELMLAAPEAARPGETIALRAYLYHEPEAIEGPTAEDGEVDVMLRDGARVLARASLVPGAQRSLEGSIEVPADAHGTLHLVARARVDAHMVATVARTLVVASDAAPAAPIDRVASPLAHFVLGALTPEAPPVTALTEPGTPLPPPPPRLDTLEAWVVGGICVPDVRCLIAVDVGLPSVEPRLSDCAGVEVLPPLPVTAMATLYYVVPIVVHGPEGTCSLDAVSVADAWRGRRLAHRSIRFPVALATPFFGVENASIEGGALRWSGVASPGREGIVVDVFHHGRWRNTLTLPAGSDPAGALAFADLPLSLPTGLYLIQARGDALPTPYVAQRLVVVGGDDTLRATSGAPALPGARGPELTFSLAAHEQSGLTLPAAVSGLADDRARLEARKRSARMTGFVGVTVGILLLVVTLLRRGLSADAEARALMAAAGVPGADDAIARRKGRLTVILTVLALGLACATGAALIAAHDLMVDAAAAAYSFR